MAESLISDKTGLVTFTIKVNGTELSKTYEVLTIEVNQAINKIPFAKLKIRDGGVAQENEFDAGDEDVFSPGSEVEILAGYHSKEELIFKGVVIKHGLKVTSSGSHLLIECKNTAIKLTVGRKNAVFTNKKDHEIISDILKSYGLEKEIKETKLKNNEIVQHYASDWDFILMRADINGMMVIVNNDKVIIKEPDLEAESIIEVNYGTTMRSFHADIDARHQLDNVTSYAWDSSTQKLIKSSGKPLKGKLAGDLDSKKIAKVIGLQEFTLQSAANIPLEALEAWATAKITRSQLALMKGKVQFRGYAKLKPGDLIELTGLSKKFNGKAFVGGLEHRIEEGDWVTEVQLGNSFDWYSAETSQIDSPAASGMSPSIKGLSTGVVKQIHQDKDGQYRIKVIIPTLQKDNIGVWARLSNLYATQGAGSFFMPELEDEVVIGFLNEDPQNAIILGMLYSKALKPPLNPEDGNPIKGFVTKGQLKVMFDDKNKVTTIITPNKNTMTFSDKDGKVTIIDENKNKIEMSSKGITIDSASDIKITAKGNIQIEAKGNIDMKATGNLKAEATIIEQKGKAKFSAEGAMAELKGSGQAVIKGGVVMIN